MFYELRTDDIKKSVPIQLKTPDDVGLKEKHIEEFLKSRLDEIVSADHLMLIGQERALQEEADLLALDKGGVLYIFELKRWQSNKENILQVMRYGQIFGRYEYSELEALAKRQQKLDGSLAQKHQEYFELDAELSESKFNHNQVFVLVTNGLDRDTISAVHYWTKKGVEIECAPYRIYEIGGKPHIQFDTYNPDDEILYEENTRFFIVNTNRSYMSDAWKDMIDKCKASAYYGRKESIRKILKNSIVYLYHTGTGVIAKGTARSDYAATDYDGDRDEEYYVPLRFDWYLREREWGIAPKAREINKQMKSGHRFRQTAFSISEDMAKAINNIYEMKKLKASQS